MLPKQSPRRCGKSRFRQNRVTVSSKSSDGRAFTSDPSIVLGTAEYRDLHVFRDEGLYSIVDFVGLFAIPSESCDRERSFDHTCSRSKFWDALSLSQLPDNDTEKQRTWADLCNPDWRRNKFAQEGTVER